MIYSYFSQTEPVIQEFDIDGETVGGVIGGILSSDMSNKNRQCVKYDKDTNTLEVHWFCSLYTPNKEKLDAIVSQFIS